ncbi:MAG TPA: LON peptidase substrate-binding domain-containing protein [Terriglobia bacterium]
MEELLLPLFPLELVLFPGEVLPLHIFEERYKEMIGECLEKRDLAPDEAEFGVVCVREKQLQVVGCSARVSQVVRRYEDGRLDILTAGQRRFEILVTNNEKSYLRAAVSFFEDDDGASPPKTETEHAHALLRQLLSRLSISEERAGLDRAFRHLSFQIAAALPLGLDFKQQVLALRGEKDRLRRLVDVMEKLIPALDLREQARAKASGNGHHLNLPKD